MAIYLFLNKGFVGVAVVRLRPSAIPTVLRYQETCLPNFIKIFKFLLKLQHAQTDGRTDSHPDINSSLHHDHLYIYINPYI